MTEQLERHTQILNIPKRTDTYAQGSATSEWKVTAVSIAAGAMLIALGVLASVPESLRNELVGWGAALIGFPSASYSVSRAIIKSGLAQGAAVVQAETIRKQPRVRRQRSSSRVADA